MLENWSPSEKHQLQQQSKQYFIHHNKIYYTNYKNPNQPLRLVQENEKKTILYNMHTDPSSVHLGRDRTLQRTLEHYFWPQMQKDIRQYVESLETYPVQLINEENFQETLQRRAYTLFSTLEGKKRIAATHIEYSQAQQKERHDNKLPPITNKFKVGNKVFLHKIKAKKQWSGKFENK
ncbi:hypothetical protein G9A89_015322 [Geosiphon pyriformis]|nr:hypothetical protein G9A89_015322 [Geosiphon pyriformis]